MNFLEKKSNFALQSFQTPAHNCPSSRPLYPRFPPPLSPIPHPLPPIPHPLSPYPRPPPPPVHPSLSSLFNLTLPSSKVPQAWKEAKLMSLQYLKKDDLSDCKNYRPVSLVSTLGKVMEKSVHKHVLNFLNTNNVVTVSLPRGAMGLSAVCDCGISLSYSLTIFVVGDSTVN